MKQAILTFEKQSVLLVELPEGATNVKMYRPFKKYFHLSCDLPPSREGVHAIFGTCFPYKNFGGKKNYPSEILLIGKLSELTEEQFAEIVDKDRSGYKDYDEDGICSIYPFVGAQGSFLSKIRAEGFFTENPSGSINECVVSAPGSGPYEYEMAMWTMGEEKTFSPAKTWVFTIKQ